METISEFTACLKEAVEKKRDEFNKKLLPDMLENYNIQISAVQAIRSILLKKGAIYDDPYKYDSKMTEVEIPSKDSFTDSEKATVLGSRLAHYETMLEFLNNYYQFNTEFLTPKRISKLLDLNTTFLWAEFTNTVNHLNTKRLADIFQAVSSGPDKLSGALLKDSLSHLAKTAIAINASLKALTVFQREAYKLIIREKIMPGLQVSKEDCLNPSRILKDIKKSFAVKISSKYPFYPELIIEILKEDYGNDSAILRQNLLSKFTQEKKKKEIKHYAESYRHSLIVGLKLLGNSAPHFQAALEKIVLNQELIYQSKNGFFKKLVKTVRQAFNLAETEKEITVIAIDPITHVKKKQIINYTQFEKEMDLKIKLFQNISSPGSAVQNKLKTLTDEDLLNLLIKYINESNELLRQMSGLDDFFKTVKPEVRAKIKGIKIEITTITNSVLKANQCRAQYTVLAEEAEQMRKLGIS